MSTRFDDLKAALSARLDRVRGNMSDAEFAALVDDVARTATRFEEIEARALGRKTKLPGSIGAARAAEARMTAGLTPAPNR
ncbi:MAG TPA: hypothetical protein VM076_21145 [Gemmatimonadaceae bacterium]|nr:hypothetical protein [Gemmatimonadaceae bacterium]